MSFSWGEQTESSERGSLGFPRKGNSGPVPKQGLLGAPPYPLYAVLEPQLPPDGFLLLEELLQGLRERWWRGDLRADSTGLELGVRQLPARPRARAGGRARPTKGVNGQRNTGRSRSDRGLQPQANCG